MQVPSSWWLTTWASQIVANGVRGGGGGGGGVPDFLRTARMRLVLPAALGGAHGPLVLGLFLLELLAPRTLGGLLGLLGDQLALGLGVRGDAARLAAQIAPGIELGAAHDAPSDDLDLPDAGAIEREHALHTLAEGDLAHRERGVHAGVLAADAQALIDLQALAVAFLHLDVHAQRIAGLEARHRPPALHLVDRGLADRVENVHRIHPFITSLRSPSRASGEPTDRAAFAA